MKIGIDLDECLGEFVYGFLEYHNEKYNSGLSRDGMVSYNFWDLIGCSRDESIKRVCDFYDTSGFKELPVVPGSREALRNLSDNNELYVITSRPDDITMETIRWLYHHYPGRFEISRIIFTNEFSKNGRKKTKANVCQGLGIDYLIEDNKDYANSCGDVGISVFLLDKPWNQGELHRNVSRVGGWYEVLDGLKGVEV